MQKLLAMAVVALVLAASCGTATTQPTPTPTPTPQVSPTATAQPSATATSSPTPTAAAEHDFVYFARDRLPPLGYPGDGAGTGATAEARIMSRLAALYATLPPNPELFNTTYGLPVRPASATVAGDVATVDFTVPGGDWGLAGSAGIKAFIQQIVYTASEEPGIRRVLITENGHEAIIGGEGVVIDHPATREDVAGYRVRASLDPMRMGGASTGLSLTPSLSVDAVAPGLVRFVVDTGLRGEAAKGGMSFSVTPRQNDEMDDLVLPGKWLLDVHVADATDSKIIDFPRRNGLTPLRGISVEQRPTSLTYTLGLDDLRPWRAAILYEPLRLVVDIGGDPDAVSANIALYQPAFGQHLQTPFGATGLIRAFEGRYEYRISDYQGNVLLDEFATASLGTSELWGTFEQKIAVLPPGGGTLQILLRSPMDGSVAESVELPISR